MTLKQIILEYGYNIDLQDQCIIWINLYWFNSSYQFSKASDKIHRINILAQLIRKLLRHLLKLVEVVVTLSSKLN